MTASNTKKTTFATTLASLALASIVCASSHREAPLITTTPKVDGTDLYMFNSYESGREDYVTIVANYQPLQDPGGGPNYFFMDPNALYEIHIDNNGDAQEDITFQFQFNNITRKFTFAIDDQNVEPAVLALGAIVPGDDSASILREEYTLNVIHGDRRTGTSTPVTDLADNATFVKPRDNIGNKTIPDYNAYADQYIYDIKLSENPADPKGRLFVGQRKDPFVVNLGEAFDLVNTNPIGDREQEKDYLFGKNITSFILEIPKSFLVATNPTIGAWTTASIPDNLGGFKQVSRLGNPLVNELVIGFSDKDSFNASEPSRDAENYLTYVTHPTFPAILNVLFGVVPPTVPRNDLVAIFLTGIDLTGGTGEPLNQDGSAAEMLRLNTTTPAVPAAEQKSLGVLDGDIAGFPNGRRPGDDVVDIALRSVMGVVYTALGGEGTAPSGTLPYSDGAIVDATMFSEAFPYLNPPIPGSPNDFTVTLNIQSTESLTEAFQNTPARLLQNGKIEADYNEESNQTFFRAESDSPGTNLRVESIDAGKASISVEVR